MFIYNWKQNIKYICILIQIIDTGRKQFMHKSLVRQGLVIGILILFIGIILQSTGSLDQKQNTSMSINPNDFLPTELWLNETQNSYLQKAIDNNEIDSDFTDSTIIAFLDKVTHRCPLLKHMGKELGLTKQDVSDVIKNIGDDNTIRNYISMAMGLLSIF